MPNRNYRRGRAYEYRVQKMLETLGYTTLRTAGSHGCCDVVAFNKREIKLISVKAGEGRASPAEREAFGLVDAPKNASKEIWRFAKRGRAPEITEL